MNRSDGISKKIIMLLILAYISTTIVALLISSYQSKGYEPSIYGAIPLIAWAMLFSNIGAGIYIITYQIYMSQKNLERPKFWPVCLLLIGLNISIISLLPSIRGYYYPSFSDEFSHLGNVMDIINSGYYTDELIYPAFHTMIAALSMVVGMKAISITKFFGIILYPFYISTIYIVSKYYLKRDIEVLLATSIATVIIFVVYDRIIVQTVSALLLPLIYYLFMKRKESSSFTLIFVIFLLLYPFFHPSTTIILILSLIIMEIVSYFIDKVYMLEEIKKKLIIKSTIILH